jgi:hypothetical protein
MSGTEKTGWFDHYRIDATDLGVTPAGTLRLEALKEGTYKFNLAYRTSDKFHAVPTFANPLFSQGIIGGQHTFDRTRDFLDADVEFRPGHRITPFLGYSWSRLEGPGRTTYHVGQDEFLLFSDLRDTDQEIRGGANFDFGRVYGSVTQGWRKFDGTETLSLGTGAGAGNNLTPILGRPVSVDTLTRHGSVEGTTPFTNAFVAGRVNSRLTLIGSFVQFSAEADGEELESVAGSLVSFPISRFFNGLEESVTSRAKNSTWRGEGRAEYLLTDGLDVSAAYRRENRELSGASVINSLFIDSVTFSGADLRDFEEILSTDNSLERDEEMITGTITARRLGPFTLRGSYTQRDQEVTISPDVAEIVIDGNGAGTFNRTVKTYEASSTFAKAGFMVAGSYRRDSADEPIFRIDFLERDRYRLRASYGRNLFRVGVTGEQLDQVNDRTGYGFDSTVRQIAGDVEVAPISALRLRGSASRYKADSLISFRRPENFAMGESIYLEEGTSWNGGVGVIYKALTLDADAGRFENEGNTPFTMDRYRARVVYDFHAKTGIAAEWSQDKYSDELSPLIDFKGTRYGIFLRYRP